MKFSGRAQFRPCIDLHDGKVKQIVGSSLGEDGSATVHFIAERPPEYFASLYRRDRLSGGHVIKLGPGNDEAAKAALRAYPGGLQLGGGVTPENARVYLDAGAAQVIVTSFLFPDGEFCAERLAEMVRAVGKERLVIDLSCRKCDGKYRIAAERWRKLTGQVLAAPFLEELGASATEFLVHAVDVEGKTAGIDEELVAFLAENSPIDCVYAGGISSIADVEKIENAGRGKIHYTVGSALDLFGGKIAYSQLVLRSQTK